MAIWIIPRLSRSKLILPCLLALGACSHQSKRPLDEAEIVGRYILESKMVPKSTAFETLVIKPDRTFFQQRLSEGEITTNVGSWSLNAEGTHLFLQHLKRWEEEDWRAQSKTRTTFELNFSAPLSTNGGRTEITLNDDVGLRFVRQKRTS